MKDTICTAIGIIGGVIASLFGGWDTALQTLVIFMAIDYITGLVVAMPSIAVYFILKSRISNLGSQIEMGIESVVNAIYLNKKTE